MRIILTTIRLYRESDQNAVIQLWDDCGLTRPWNNPQIDIYRKLTLNDGLFLVATINDKIVGSVMGGYDGHRGWANYLAVASAHQHQGIASELMQNLEQRLIARGCPKIQLLIRKGNSAVIDFYEKLGYVDTETICMGKRLIED